MFKDLVKSDTFYLSSAMLEMTFPPEQKTEADGALGSSENPQEFSFASLRVVVRVFLALCQHWFWDREESFQVFVSSLLNSE